MSISGSGVGGSIGGQQQPSINEQEQTAATQILKLTGGLAITKDTIDLGFYELGGQIGRYPANSNRPVLPPLIKTRGPSDETESGENWNAALSALINALPPDVQTEYLKQMALPLDQRNLDAVALNNVLINTALAMTWVQNTAGPSMTEGVASIDKVLKMSLPYIALDGLIGYSGTVLSQAADFLSTVGVPPNQLDALSHFIRLIGKGLGEMEGLQSELLANNKPPTESFGKLANELTLLSSQYAATMSGTEMCILGVNLAAMASLTAALSIAGTGNPTLYIALSLFSIGLESGSSEAGFIGSALSGIASSLGSGLGSLFLQETDLAGRNMLEMVLVSSFIGSVAMASLTTNLGYIPNEQTRLEADRQEQATVESARQSEADVQAARKFSQELALALFSHSGVVESTFSALIETFGLAPMQQKYLMESMKLLSLTTLFLAASPTGNPADSAYLFEGLEGTYGQSLTTLSNWVNEELMDQNIQGETANALSISLGQAKIALEEGNFPEVIDSLLSSLSLVGSSSPEFMANLDTVRGYVQLMGQSLTTGTDDQTNTQTRVSFIV